MPFVAQGSTSKRQFTGHERDPESGLDYMMARYYSSSLGRFVASDPMYDTVRENPQSWNRNAYVRNNPMRHTDPKGTMGQMDNEGMPKFVATGPTLTTQQLGQMRESLSAVSVGTGMATLVTLEVPPVSGALAVTSATTGYLAVGCDIAIWVKDPSGGNFLVLIVDGAAIVVGRWAGELFEDFLTVPGVEPPLGVRSAADAAAGVAIDEGSSWWYSDKGQRTAPKGPFRAWPWKDPEPTVTVGPEHWCGSKPC